MHVSGKIFIWLALIGWGGALYLTNSLLKFRSGWVEAVETLREDNEKKAEQIETAESELNVVETELTATTRGWGQVWGGIECLDVGPDGTLALGGLGADLGLGRRAEGVDTTDQRLVVNVFRPLDPEGQDYEFVGYFDVHEPGPTDSRARPLWKIRPVQVERLQAAVRGGLRNNWRVREMIPSGVTAGFSDLERQIHEKEELLGKRGADRVIAERTKTASEVKLARRTEELVGTGVGDNGGLLGDLEVAVRDRDAVLAEVDEMRRRVSDGYAMLKKLEQQNRELGKQLPGAKDYDE